MNFFVPVLRVELNRSQRLALGRRQRDAHDRSNLELGDARGRSERGVARRVLAQVRLHLSTAFVTMVLLNRVSSRLVRRLFTTFGIGRPFSSSRITKHRSACLNTLNSVSAICVSSGSSVERPGQVRADFQQSPQAVRGRDLEEVLNAPLPLRRLDRGHPASVRATHFVVVIARRGLLQVIRQRADASGIRSSRNWNRKSQILIRSSGLS